MNNIYLNDKISKVKFINYTGAYPNLCGGILTLEIDGKVVEFPKYCMYSGGYVLFDTELYEKRHDNCPLKPLTDRLAEERKKVVQEIKQRLIKYTGFDEEYLQENIYDADMGCILKQIDKFERGK